MFNPFKTLNNESFTDMSSFEDHYERYIFPYLANNHAKASMMITNAKAEAIRISKMMVQLAFLKLEPALETPDLLGGQVIIAPEAPYSSLVALGSLIYQGR